MPNKQSARRIVSEVST